MQLNLRWSSCHHRGRCPACPINASVSWLLTADGGLHHLSNSETPALRAENSPLHSSLAVLTPGSVHGRTICDFGVDPFFVFRYLKGAAWSHRSIRCEAEHMFTLEPGGDKLKETPPWSFSVTRLAPHVGSLDSGGGLDDPSGTPGPHRCLSPLRPVRSHRTDQNIDQLLIT